MSQCQNLSELLIRAAEANPDRPALLYAERCVSYGELDSLVDGLCGALGAAGVCAGNLVGVLGAKSIATVAACQAILRCDAVYVPLDVRMPSARLAAIVQACGLRHIVSDSAGRRHHDALRAAGASAFIDLDSPSAAPPRRARPGRSRADMAFILHTSGSTGQPKGVMISHGNALAFVEWGTRHFGLTEQDRLLCHAPLTFDLPVFDLYASFMLGAAAVLVPDTAALFPAETARIIRKHRVTSLFMVPSAMIAMMTRGGWLDEPPATLTSILYSGEPFPLPPLSRLLEWGGSQLRVANLYGPIETNACTYYDVTKLPVDASAVPIGFPIANTEIRLLADDPAAHGEILVAGPTVALGYFENAELTAAKWVELDGRRWYRTGDLGRKDEQGRLWYEGRLDFMIKSRGFRIELGEIETALGRCEGVEEAVAVAVPHEELGHLVYAWVTPEALPEPELKHRLQQSLPNYMIPQRICAASSLPRTQSGKLDRGALIQMAASLKGSAA